MSHTCDIIISKYINLGSPARFDWVQLSVALTLSAWTVNHYSIYAITYIEFTNLLICICRMSVPCEAQCSRWFTSIGSMNSHLSKARSCAWYEEGKLRVLYIIFVKFFFTNYPNVLIPLLMLLHFVLIILPHVTLSTFILISGFKWFSIVPNFYMCSRLPFHILSPFFPCALTLFTTFSELLWHLIFLCFILIMLPTYLDAVYKPMNLPSSSSVCKLMLIPLLSYLLSKSPLSSKVSIFSLVALLILW